MQITKERLLYYQRCQRRGFLDVHGDRHQQTSPSDYLLKLKQDSQVHRLEVLAQMSTQTPVYSKGDWETGMAETLALMEQGAEAIQGGVLIGTTTDGIALISQPDVLIRQQGDSAFGSWCYVPAEIKFGKRPKPEYQVVAAFHARLVAQAQGQWPPTARLILRNHKVHRVFLPDWVPRLERILADYEHMLLQAQEPEVFIARNRCDLCHWYGTCYAIAQQGQHLSLLPGITPSRYQVLKTLGILSLAELAHISPESLATGSEFNPGLARQLVRQAWAVQYNQPLLNHPLPNQPSSNQPLLNQPPPNQPSSNQFLFNQFLFNQVNQQRFNSQEQENSEANTKGDRPVQPLGTLPTLPLAAVELYFDIEAEPDLNLAYLHGVLVVDRYAQTQTFHALLVDNPDTEEQVWHQLLRLLWQYPDAPIFHFCDYEVQVIQRLGRLYRTPNRQLKPLLSRCCDLHAWVTTHLTLPVESYALKPIARWLGFQWRDGNANGAQSVYWYSRWKVTGDRQFLDAILRYNEDDCRATYHVKETLQRMLNNPVH